MTDAFDADALIYAVNDPVRAPAVLRALAEAAEAIGSVILLPETLSKPLRSGRDREHAALEALLGRIDLKPVDSEIAEASVAFGAVYGLRAADAIHLATAVVWGAERFHTGNKKDFGPHIREIEVVHPE